MTFRKINQDAPTLLLDEVDTIFSANGDENKEGLRALLNAGFVRGTMVPRCVGPNYALTDFDVFCPKALAGIGKLPDTVADRCIPIVMARRKPGEVIDKFRRRDAEVSARPITVALEAWGKDEAVISMLRAAHPEIPSALSDRAADICEPLLAIADLAGGEWPEMSRSALAELFAGSAVSDEDIGIRLLTAIREIFQAKHVDRISTKDLLDALIERDEPWAAWWEADIMKGNTRGPAAKLARLLRPFGIIPETIRESDDSTPKGYKLALYEDAFSRYLPPPPALTTQQRHNPHE